jgi:hypothetical protein
MDTIAATLIAHLRRVSPVKVRVYDSSDEYRDVAVPQRRRRWGQVVEAIEARPWVRCELLDKSGAALAYVENAGPAGDLEDLGGSEPKAAAAQQTRYFLELMIKAQTTALTFRDKEHAALLASVREVLEVQTQSMREMMLIMREQRDAAAEVATMRAAAESGSDIDQVVKIIEASPKLMQMMGPVVAMLRTPKKIAAPQAVKPNGAPPPAPNGAGK